MLLGTEFGNACFLPPRAKIGKVLNSVGSNDFVGILKDSSFASAMWKASGSVQGLDHFLVISYIYFTTRYMFHPCALITNWFKPSSSHDRRQTSQRHGACREQIRQLVVFAAIVRMSAFKTCFSTTMTRLLTHLQPQPCKLYPCPCPLIP